MSNLELMQSVIRQIMGYFEKTEGFVSVKEISEDSEIPVHIIEPIVSKATEQGFLRWKLGADEYQLIK